MALAAIRSDPADALNDAQRLAVEHGDEPLLVIAGAGSGKTATLAHRVAHLVLAGADPQAHPADDLLAPRRGRDQPPRPAHPRPPPRPEAAAAATPSLERHLPRDRRAAVARIRAAHRPRSRLHHPRPRGFRRPDGALPPRARPLEEAKSASRPRRPAWPSIRASSTRELPLERGARPALSLGAGARRAQLRGLFAAYVEAKQRQHVLDYDDLLLYLAADARRAGARGRDVAARFDHRAGRRIPGHQPAAGRDPADAQARRARPHRGRRRRAVDLLLPRRDRAQHPRLSAALLAAGARRHARAQLPLDPADPRRRQRA